jgi:hypothetical protein
MINGELLKYSGKKEDFVCASLFVIKRLMEDKIISVLLNTVDHFGMMMKKFRPNSINSAMSNVKSILQKLSEYLGHNNEKFR